MNMPTLIKVSSLLLFLALLAGCTPAATPQPTSPVSAAPPTQDTQPAVTTETPAPQTGVTLVDALGRTLNFETPPRRIVLAGRALFMVADALYAFPQAPERVVVTGDTGQGRENNFITLLDPAYSQKAVLAGDASAEQIAAADPDAVVLKSYLAETLGAPLDALGIPVVYVDLENSRTIQPRSGYPGAAVSR